MGIPARSRSSDRKFLERSQPAFSRRTIRSCLSRRRAAETSLSTTPTRPRRWSKRPLRSGTGLRTRIPRERPSSTPIHRTSGLCCGGNWLRFLSVGHIDFCSLPMMSRTGRPSRTCSTRRQQAGVSTSSFLHRRDWWDGARIVAPGGWPLTSVFKLYPWEWMVREEFGERLSALVA